VHAGGRAFVWAGQTALKFYERLAVDEDYQGLALDYAEGERIARAAGDADVLMLKNHARWYWGRALPKPGTISTTWSALPRSPTAHREAETAKAHRG